MYLLAANDAGPAHYLAIVGETLGKEAVFLASPLTEPIFAAKGIAPFNPFLKQELDAVVSGTCLGPGIDKDAIILAREMGIPAISVIEHWSWYRERFILNGELRLPDFIALNDQYALEDATAAGLPPAILRIVGNPVLEQISSLRVPDRALARTRHGFAADDRICLFVSEELRSDFPPGSNAWQGFDEFEVLSEMLRLAPEFGLKPVIKMHPAEDPEKYRIMEAANGVAVLGALPKEDIFALSDIMLGMGSMLLIEAALAGVKQVIAYRPGERHSFIGSRVGACITARSPSELSHFLASSPVSSGSNDFSLAFRGSTDRFISFLRQISG